MLDYDFHLTTPRLFISHLNPANDAHVNFIFEQVFHHSPDVADKDQNSEAVVESRRTSRKFIVDNVERLANIGFGRFVISLRPPSALSDSLIDQDQKVPFSQQTHELIGIVSMQKARFEGAPSIPDVGFSLLERYYGKGYATEGAKELLRYFEEEKGCKQFAGICFPDNEGSKKVLRRLGFEERGMRDLHGVLGQGKVGKLLVWTLGVGQREEDLKFWAL